jgi:cyclopropane fatty-acyl-phospholipid synthase-like methyltransferase
MKHEDYIVQGYEAFRERALNPAISRNEKCGFPETLRAGKAEAILADISSKVTALGKTGARILDIGAGCSDLALCIIEAAGKRGQSLTVIDSPEMLSLLPDAPHLTKLAGAFPDCLQAAEQPIGRFDAILAYSVIQYVFANANLFAFVDAAAQLLDEPGELLIGDIPNASMRNRFLSSSRGRAYHEAHYPSVPEPRIATKVLPAGEIDDGVMLGLVARMRSAGLHAFLMPQSPALPMANRREDLLIVSP